MTTTATRRALPAKAKMAKRKTLDRQPTATVPMEFSSPESSNIDGARYNQESGRLTVFFRNSGIYDFAGVPSAVWAGFATAASKGAYFSQFIRPLYTGVKRDEAKRA
jgi:hypothetical protein